jgi:hypothetical protein
MEDPPIRWTEPIRSMTNESGARYRELRLYRTNTTWDTRIPKNERGRPVLVRTIGLLLKPLDEFEDRRRIANTGQLDRLIVEIMDDDARIAYLGDNNYFYYYDCCAHCGDALGLGICRGCGRDFRYDHSIGNIVGVPPKVRAWLAAQGHILE